MSGKLEITINDIMKRDIFKYASVIAGKGGLQNQVNWTHILETNHFESLINGNELILTTGAGLMLDNPDGTFFLKKLIAKNVAGICVELGTHVNFISKEVIVLADKHKFPIIVFDHFIKFINITQDLHSLIIHNHHNLLKLLNELSMRFIELSLLPNGVLKILEELFTYTNGKALYLTNKKECYYYPPETRNIKENLQTRIKQLDKTTSNRQYFSFEDKKFLLVPVKGSGVIWGYLCLQLEDYSLKNIIFPALEQAALAIAQIMLRNKTTEERKQYNEDKLVRNLLYGIDYNLNELKQEIPILRQNFSFRLILIQKSKNDFHLKGNIKNETNLQKAILLRFILNENDFFPAISIADNEIAIIAFFKKSLTNESKMNSFLQVINTIKHAQEESIFEGKNYLIGISNEKQNLSQMTKCYQEAKKTLFLKKANIKSSIFYEKTGIYRLLLNQSSETLESYVIDFLQPLIDYDNKKSSQLLKTLEVYLECHNSKKEASKKLFIVRQTLYHRLQKIEELLGEDFLEPHNRIAIESAIKAKHVLKFKDRL